MIKRFMLNVLCFTVLFAITIAIVAIVDALAGKHKVVRRNQFATWCLLMAVMFCPAAYYYVNHVNYKLEGSVSKVYENYTDVTSIYHSDVFGYSLETTTTVSSSQPKKIVNTSISDNKKTTKGKASSTSTGTTNPGVGIDKASKGTSEGTTHRFHCLTSEIEKANRAKSSTKIQSTEAFATKDDETEIFVEVTNEASGTDLEGFVTPNTLIICELSREEYEKASVDASKISIQKVDHYTYVYPKMS